MNFDQFREHIKNKCMYETIYDDSEGRPTLVIRELDAFTMVNRLIASERDRFAQECIDLVAQYGGSVQLEAAIRARSES